MKILHMIAFTLVIIGGINWGLLALTNWEIGSLFGGMDALISQIIYILVGASAIYLAVMHKKECRNCSATTDKNADIPHDIGT
ncbi:MAG: DUF378 domain-containing protein [Patescibacteria group bacterium UBA2163]